MPMKMPMVPLTYLEDVTPQSVTSETVDQVGHAEALWSESDLNRSGPEPWPRARGQRVSVWWGAGGVTSRGVGIHSLQKRQEGGVAARLSLKSHHRGEGVI